MAARPITPDERSRIEQLARDGLSRNDIARETGRSAGSITAIVRAAGLSFDRAATAAATEAKQRDNAARRAELIEGMYEDALRLRRQMFAPTKAFNFGGRDNTYAEVDLDEPTFRDKRDLAQSIKSLADGAANLERVGEGGGIDEAQSMLAGIAAGLAAVHQAAQAPPPATDADT